MLRKNPRQDRQDDLFRPRLENIIDPRHELVKLALMIDWDGLEADLSCFHSSDHKNIKGRIAFFRTDYVANIIEFLRQAKKSCFFHEKFLLSSMIASLFLLLSISFIVQIFINEGSYQTAIAKSGDTISIN